MTEKEASSTYRNIQLGPLVEEYENHPLRSRFHTFSEFIRYALRGWLESAEAKAAGGKGGAA